MNPKDDWKWKLALAVLVVIAAVVVFWPLPGATLSKQPASAKVAGPGTDAADAASSAVLDFDSNVEAALRYTVQEDDTVEGISRLFVVSAENIRRMNHIPAGRDVAPGQLILIPHQAPE